MKITKLLTDEVVLDEIGKRIAQSRLDLQMTQAEVARDAGVAKRTLERMEAGHSSQLSSLIRVLRVLDAMAGLDGLIPEIDTRPMELLKNKGKTRKRAKSRKNSKVSASEWTWGDEK